MDEPVCLNVFNVERFVMREIVIFESQLCNFHKICEVNNCGKDFAEIVTRITVFVLLFIFFKKRKSS